MVYTMKRLGSRSRERERKERRTPSRERSRHIVRVISDGAGRNVLDAATTVAYEDESLVSQLPKIVNAAYPLVAPPSSSSTLGSADVHIVHCAKAFDMDVGALKETLRVNGTATEQELYDRYIKPLIITFNQQYNNQNVIAPHANYLYEILFAAIATAMNVDDEKSVVYSILRNVWRTTLVAIDRIRPTITVDLFGIIAPILRRYEQNDPISLNLLTRKKLDAVTIAPKRIVYELLRELTTFRCYTNVYPISAYVVCAAIAESVPAVHKASFWMRNGVPIAETDAPFLALKKWQHAPSRSLKDVHVRELAYQQIAQLFFSNLKQGQLVSIQNQAHRIVCTDIFPTRIRIVDASADERKRPLLPELRDETDIADVLQNMVVTEPFQSDKRAHIEASSTFEGYAHYVRSAKVSNPMHDLSLPETFQVHDRPATNNELRIQLMPNMSSAPSMFVQLDDVALIGKGTYGSVYAGTMCVADRQNTTVAIPVAVKVAIMPVSYNDTPYSLEAFNKMIRSNTNTNDLVASMTVSQLARLSLSPAFPLLYHSFLGYDLCSPTPPNSVVMFHPVSVMIMQRAEIVATSLFRESAFGTRYAPRVDHLWSYVGQGLLCLIALSRFGRMRHDDAHSKNWMIQNVPPDSILAYRSARPNRFYAVPTYSRRVFLIDYGFASHITLAEAEQTPVSARDAGYFFYYIYHAFDLIDDDSVKTVANVTTFIRLLRETAANPSSDAMTSACATQFANFMNRLLTFNGAVALFANTREEAVATGAFNFTNNDLDEILSPFAVSGASKLEELRARPDFISY